MNELETLLGAELAKQVAEKLGDKKLVIDDGKMIPKSRFDEVNEAKNALQKQLDEVTKTQQTAIDKAVETYKKQLDDVSKNLKAMEKKVGDNEDLSKQMNDYRTQLETKQKEFEETRKVEKETFEKQIAQQKLDLLLENNLIKSQAKNTKAVKALLELDKVKLDGDNIIGLNEQIEKLKQSDAWLFGETTVAGTKSSDKDTGFQPKGFYTEAEVGAMSQELIQANIETVMKSMKEWHK